MEQTSFRALYADSDEGELHKDIMSAFAEFENRKRVQRSRDGKIGKVKAGHVLPLGGRLPYGYDFVEGQLVINEVEGAVARQIYHWLIIERLSSYAIAQRLYELDIPTKGDTASFVVKKSKRCAWSPVTVRGILSNPVYKGVWYYGKRRVQKANGKRIMTPIPESEWLAVEVPAIVDPETWQQAQACLKRNQIMSKRNTKREYLLRSFVFCQCGRRWVSTSNIGRGYVYYRCPGASNQQWRTGCNVTTLVRQDTLDAVVWQAIKDDLLHPDKLRVGIEEHKQANQAERDLKTTQLEAVKRQLADVDRKMAILLDEILANDFAQTVIDQKKRDLKKQHDDLVGQVRRLEQDMQLQTITTEQEMELLEFADRVWQGLNNFTFEEKRYTLETLDIRVEMLSPQQAKISGKLTPGFFIDITS